MKSTFTLLSILATFDLSPPSPLCCDKDCICSVRDQPTHPVFIVFLFLYSNLPDCSGMAKVFNQRCFHCRVIRLASFLPISLSLLRSNFAFLPTFHCPLLSGSSGPFFQVHLVHCCQVHLEHFFRFIWNMANAFTTAFGTGSSSATLPVTIALLEEKNEVKTSKCKKQTNKCNTKRKKQTNALQCNKCPSSH